jgi:hypothetical protein
VSRSFAGLSVRLACLSLRFASLSLLPGMDYFVNDHIAAELGLEYLFYCRNAGCAYCSAGSGISDLPGTVRGNSPICQFANSPMHLAYISPGIDHRSS